MEKVNGEMSVLGIIGGMGPMATAYFLQLIVQMTDAATDQEHIEILVHSKPGIPDRTSYILGKSQDNPMPEMIEIGKKLADQGAGVLAIPCITAHYFQKELEEFIGIPIINAIEETADYLAQRHLCKVGIMATDGTIESGIFQRELEKKNIEVVLPSKENQKNVMYLIYENVKAGIKLDKTVFEKVSEELFEKGAGVILLGCTELSLMKRDDKLGDKYLDVMEVLARKAVLSCGKLAQRYEELLFN